MKLTPKFRFATAASSPTLSLSSDPNMSFEPPIQLIPGLPDDVALNCLLRVPVKCHLSCRLVSRQWHNLFSSKSHFFTIRKTLKLQSPYHFTLAYYRCTGKIEWRVLDLTHLSWHTIPSMPCWDRPCPRGFGFVSLPSIGSLLVCGALVSDIDCPLHLVLKYDVYKNKWTVLPPMLSARSFFGGGVIDGRVYVAGGIAPVNLSLIQLRYTTQ
jgi:F-box domain